MGRTAKRDHLAQALNSHAQSIHETFQLFDQSSTASLEKVDWPEVIKLGGEISKQATIAGMLWTGEKPDVGELEENMRVYCNMLQGFVLLSHGSTVGAGPTLRACIHASVKQVVERGLLLLQEAVSSYEARNSDKRTSIPQLSGSVWEACAALKKTPSTNYMAIGRAVTQVAVSVKDVLREMRELKPATTVSADEIPTGASDTECESHEEDGSSDGDLGHDLSLEEMTVAQLAIDIVSDTLAVLKEVIRFISVSPKKSNLECNIWDSVDSLERLLKYCQEIGVQVDELGASVYPPQEFLLMNTIVEKISDGINGLWEEVGGMEGSSEDLSGALERLKSSLGKLQSGLASVGGDVIPEMRCLAV